MFPLGRVVHPQKGPSLACYLGPGEVQRHVAVIGSPGSGKTSNVLVPWMVHGLVGGYGVVAVDTKGDLLEDALRYKNSRAIAGAHELYRWDITKPITSRPWNPVSEVSNRQAAGQLATAILGEIDPADSQKHFAERDLRWLTGMIVGLSETRPGSGTLIDLARMAIDQHLLASVMAGTSGALDMLDLVQVSIGDFAKATAGLSNRLAWANDPTLAPMLSGRGSRAFKLDDLLANGGLLVVGASLAAGEAGAMSAAMLINLLRQRCLERFGQNPAPLLWILDEVPQYAARIRLDQMLDVIRSANVACVLGMQDVASLGDDQQRMRMLANCHAVIGLKGLSPASAAFLSARLGDRLAPSTSTQTDHRGRQTPGVSFQHAPVLGSKELMYPPVGRFGGTVHIPGVSPAPWLVSFD